MLSKINYLTSGESHGQGLLGIIDGIPAGLEISEKIIFKQLLRRQKGYGRGGRMKIENDYANIWGGVRNGKTLGSPIGLLIKNKDWENWTNKMSVNPIKGKIKKITLPRPGHADLAGLQKFGEDDIRNILERASARETAMRVALATICRELLKNIGITIGSHVTQIYNIKNNKSLPEGITPEEINIIADKSPIRCLNKNVENKIIKLIDNAKKEGNSVGGKLEIIASGLPYGLGSHTQWDKKLSARLTESIMSVNAFKGIEIGNGFMQAGQLGSDVHDEIGWDGNKFIRYTNHAGGIEGGMSNAQDIIIRAVMKPIPTLIKPLRSVDYISKEEKLAHKERTDSCSVPAASIIAESMVCIVLADAILEKFCGDSIEQLKSHINISAKY